jgi:hypothetical protein
MKHLPVKSTRAVRRRDDTPIEVEPVRTRGPFMTFHYAYTEVSVRGGSAQVRRRTTRLEDGRITTESFEGTLEPGAYDAAVREVQRAFVEPQAALLKMFAAILPFRRTPRDEE